MGLFDKIKSIFTSEEQEKSQKNRIRLLKFLNRMTPLMIVILKR